MITRNDIRKKIGEIAEAMHDPELAHGKEDDLYDFVLTAIATGNTDDPKGLAMEALKTKKMDFERWYA